MPNGPMMISSWWRALDPNILILTGGNDLGEKPLRDETEGLAITLALDKGLPILGICRGFQLLARRLGATIEADIKSTTGENHIAQDHMISVSPVPDLEIRTPSHIMVNSFHGQGVVDMGAKSTAAVFAKSAGGIIEGIYHKEKRMLGLQWHPERKGPNIEFDKNVIKCFFETTLLGSE